MEEKISVERKYFRRPGLVGDWTDGHVRKRKKSRTARHLTMKWGTDKPLLWHPRVETDKTRLTFMPVSISSSVLFVDILSDVLGYFATIHTRVTFPAPLPKTGLIVTGRMRKAKRFWRCFVFPIIFVTFLKVSDPRVTCRCVVRHSTALVDANQPWH